MGFRPEQLTLHPSRRLRLVLGGLHLAGGIAVVLSGMPDTLKWSMLAVLVVSIYRTGWREPRNVISALRWDAETVAIQQHDLAWQPVSIGSRSRIFPFALFLELMADDGRRWWLPVFADAADQDGFRRLQVELRYRISSSPPQS